MERLDFEKRHGGPSIWIDTFIHNKTGHEYWIHHIALLEKDLTPVVMYSRVNSPEEPNWVRPESEFFDGRFTRKKYKRLDDLEF